MSQYKICTNCNKNKLISEFSITKYYCKECRNKYQSDWAKKVGYHKKTYKKPGLRSPPSSILGNKFKRLTVIEYLGLRDDKYGKRSWYKCKCECGNIVEVLGTSLTSGNTGTCGCRIKKRKNENDSWTGCGDIWGSHWSSIRHGAKIRNIPFEITIQQAWELFNKQNSRCKLTGLPIEFNKIVHGSKTASLDRIDSTKGYTIDNVQWLHKDINHMKQEFSQDKFIDLCRKVTNYNA